MAHQNDLSNGSLYEREVTRLATKQASPPYIRPTFIY